MGRNRKPEGRPLRDRQLLFSVTLADCEIQDFSAGGPGGQHQNHSNTGIRIIHRESGARGESREERSQLLNKRKAFLRMTEHPKFKVWVNRQVWFRGEPPEERVKRDMEPRKLRVEVREEGKWVPEEPAVREDNRPRCRECHGLLVNGACPMGHPR